MEFQYNEEEETYFTTKKLKDGYMTRIYFYPVEKPKNKIMEGRFYGIGLAIAKSKKDLNNWLYVNGHTRVNTDKQYSKFGISVLIWAKKMIVEFCNEYSFKKIVLVVFSTNNKRYQVYKRGLKDFKPSIYNNQKMLYKNIWE